MTGWRAASSLSLREGGFITPQRVEEIETIAARHGIHLAPLYNADGPLEAAHDCRSVTVA
jgi:hypothetical protein